MQKMKSTNTFGVHFILRPNKKQNEKSPIYARITVNRTRCEVSLKYSLHLDEWNTAKGAAKPKNETLRQLNSYLEEIRGKIINYYHDIVRNGQKLTAFTVKNAFLGIDPGEKKYSLLWLIEEHNRVMEKALSPGSLKNYYTTARYLKNFLDQKYNIQDMLLADLKFEFITAFEFFIRNNPIKQTDPCTNNGTMKHLERLKKIMNWAVRNEWIKTNPFIHYKLKYKHSERSFISETELSILENIVLSNEMLRQVRDMFIFSCYTGLSYIDLVNLKKDQVITGPNNVRWIRTTRAKSNVGVSVPILEHACILMNKFNTANPVLKDNVFPKISNQEMNRSLKIIAELCGLRKYLTFHLARHTFATTITLMNGVPIESISKMLGHSKLSTTMVYARVTQLKVGMDMELLQKKLDDNNARLNGIQ